MLYRVIGAAPTPGTTWSRPARPAITARAASSSTRPSCDLPAARRSHAVTCTRYSRRTCATTATRAGARTSSLATEGGRARPPPPPPSGEPRPQIPAPVQDLLATLWHGGQAAYVVGGRSEEHTSELQSR